MRLNRLSYISILKLSTEIKLDRCILFGEAFNMYVCSTEIYFARIVFNH